MELTITKIGEETAVILPPDILDKLRVVAGDTVVASDLVDGVKLSSRVADYAEAMVHAERVMEENESALKRLAE